MCCVCGGGAYTDDTSDDDTSTDLTYGTVYDEAGSWVASWSLNQTETEDGYWEDTYEEVIGYWTYDEDSTDSGTWWHTNYTSQGTWYTDTTDSTIKHIVVTEADPDGTYIDASEGAINGYWFYNYTQTGGHWVNEESSDSGYWEQDYDSITTGTWLNMNYTQYGTWYIDSEDSTIMHIVHYCEDTNDGETNSAGEGCIAYAYDWCSSTEYNTDTFNAQEMCCICGGGNYNDETGDD